eukprot:606334-Hanusia_phi.AAC.1
MIYWKPAQEYLRSCRGRVVLTSFHAPAVFPNALLRSLPHAFLRRAKSRLSSTTRSHLDSHPSPAPALRAIASDAAPSVAHARTTTAQTDQAVPLEDNVQPAALSQAASCTSYFSFSSSSNANPLTPALPCRSQRLLLRRRDQDDRGRSLAGRVVGGLCVSYLKGDSNTDSSTVLRQFLGMTLWI